MEIVNKVLSEDVEFNTGDIFYHNSSLDYYILAEISEEQYALLDEEFIIANSDYVYDSFVDAIHDLNYRVQNGEFTHYSKNKYKIQLIIKNK